MKITFKITGDLHNAKCHSQLSVVLLLERQALGSVHRRLLQERPSSPGLLDTTLS